jgi:hypothetical protein
MKIFHDMIEVDSSTIRNITGENQIILKIYHSAKHYEE